MKTVTLYALIIPTPRQCKTAMQWFYRVMKYRIETGNLGYIRIQFSNKSDGLDIVRLV